MVETLQKLGLSNKEAKVYLAVLELGPSRIPLIADKSKIKRTTVYVLLESLMQKGIVSLQTTKNTKKFIAEKPQRLMNLLKEKEKDLKQILPELEALANTQKYTRPEVRFYHGKEGYITIAEETLETPNSTILCMGSLVKTYNIVGKDYDSTHYIPMRLKKNIIFKGLLFKDQASMALKRDEKKYKREIKFLPQNFEFECYMTVFPNKIAMMSSEEELIGVVIKSPGLAQMEKQKFEMLWNLL